MRPRTLVLVAAVLVVCATAIAFGLRWNQVTCQPLLSEMPADGRFHAVAELRRRTQWNVPAEDVSVRGIEPSRFRIVQDRPGATLILYRAPLTGGLAHVQPWYAGRHWSFPIRATPTWSDHATDGLPDALHLHSPEDRLRFRRWFTTLADQAAAVPDRDLPSEVTDCSALLRYCYRLALGRHDDRWYKQFAPGTVPTLPSVEQWSYPETPMGAGLFRVTPAGAGKPQARDFAEFADAKTLYSRNSFRVGRDVHLSRPGDLLFFHQLQGEGPYHSMIVTGAGGEWVVYHTGPGGSGAPHVRGEMRRARIADLLQHPDPHWHPSANNPNFLGVFRWNLLRED